MAQANPQMTNQVLDQLVALLPTQFLSSIGEPINGEEIRSALCLELDESTINPQCRNHMLHMFIQGLVASINKESGEGKKLCDVKVESTRTGNNIDRHTCFLYYKPEAMQL